MAYSPAVGEVVEKLGYKWIILDESAILKTKDTSDGVPAQPDSSEVDGKQTIYIKRNSQLAVFIRDRRLSLAIAFSQITSVSQLLDFLKRENNTRYELRSHPITGTNLASNTHLDENGYVIVALDGETFGHHQPGQLKFLEELFTWNLEPGTWNMVTISELLKLFPQRLEIEPKTSTWGESWERWDDPKNPIHRLQWKLYRLALKVGGAGGDEFSHPTLAFSFPKSSHSTMSLLSKGAAVRVGMSKIVARRPLNSRALLDRALHSDQFWWASHSPCWHPKMIERGTRTLRDVVLLSPASQEKEKEEAQKLYNNIIITGRKLYGDKIITK
jgi:hypothetical protein